MSTALADGLTIAKRNVIKIKRTPDLLGSVVTFPIVFVLMLVYVFGAMIEIPGMSYAEYMIPGIFVQTVVMSSQITGYTLVLDLQKGIFDRFRTLPMAPSAVLTGQTLGDVLMNAASILVMSLMGLLVGWRINGSPLEAITAFAVLLFFAYAFSWVTATVALALRTPEVFNNIATIVTFPIMFLSNIFIDSSRLAGPLQAIAEWNPVSAVTQALRELFGNTSSALPVPDVWPLQNPLLATLGWSVVLLLVFVPLATRLYKRSVS